MSASMCTRCSLFLWLALGLMAAGVAGAAPPDAASVPDIALYYQADPPADQLKAFDIVVLDPAQTRLPDAAARPGPSQWFARLRTADLIQLVRDPSAVVHGRLATLKAQGYTGFLLDDGVALGQDDPQARERMRQVLRIFRRHDAGTPLILRNHVDLALADARRLRAVVVDGLHTRGIVRNGLVEQTSPVLQARALDDVRRLRAVENLPVVTVDYCKLHDLRCRRTRAQALVQEGLTPYVTDPDMSVIGVGALEVLPRKILVVQPVSKEPIDQSTGVRLYAMPLNQLGYALDYVDVDHLPARLTRDRYAGVVVALNDRPAHPRAWRDWLLDRVREGMPVAVMGTFGFDVGPLQARALDLQLSPGKPDPLARVRIVHRDPIMGFETMPAPDPRALSGFRVGSGGRALLTVGVGDRQYDMAGLTRWGGFALDNMTVVSIAGLPGDRWVLQPLEFFRQALRLPLMPVPVVTTENGVRLLFVHIDGDGFASKAEFPGNQFSAQVLRDRILKKYPIPHTVSVIQGEIGRDGMYPRLSGTLEQYAREIFALPNVELASHTFSHPFEWDKVEGSQAGRADIEQNQSEGSFYLKIPGYTFDLDKEISGSIDYINTRLAPPGKRVLVLQWSGDAMPSARALAKTAQAGVLNINGGDTTITEANKTWTAIAPIGVSKGPGDSHYQVYVGAMNENVYTDDWQGPYYGYRNVRQTFALTGSPIRFKPINLYYHFYSATKIASLKALEQSYDFALREPVYPIYTSEYIHRVLDWRHVAVGRKGGRWLIQSGEWLRELRWPRQQVPRLDGSRNIAGYWPGPDGTYVHMGASRAAFALADQDRGRYPQVAEAAGMIRSFQREGRNMRFRFGGYYRPFLVLKGADGCRVQVDGEHRSARQTIWLSGTAAKPVQEHQVEVSCD